MRLIFLGSPPFATPVLDRILSSKHEVSALVTRPDRPQGRGRKVESSSLIELARRFDKGHGTRGIPVLQPAKTSDAGFLDELRAFEPRVLLVASFGEILKQELLELAPLGALNVHGSLLPRHRGASPIQHAVLAGDRETGVSIQRIVLALDEGDVLLEERTPIGEDETSGDLFERLAILGGEAAVRALDLLESGDATFTPQDHDKATYARKIKKSDGVIDWSQPAEQILRHVRAMNPWPGASTSLPDGARLTVLKARLVDSPAGDSGAGSELPAGSVVPDDKHLFVTTGSGLVELCEVKPAGKKAMAGDAFLRGARLAGHTVLGA